MAKQNYTEEMTTFLVNTYREMKSEGKSNAEIFKFILLHENFTDKNERSLRSKLSRLQEYIPDTVNKSEKVTKDGLPDKKTLITKLIEVSGISDEYFDGLKPASKPALNALINVFEKEI